MRFGISHRALRLGLVPGAIAVLVGCDLSQSQFYLSAIEGVPGIVDYGELTLLTSADFADGTSYNEQVVYGELGPTGTAFVGGGTFTFTGYGGSVCILVDPELASWVESVSSTNPIAGLTEPDNVFDDGDLDLVAGASIYYTGTPGQRLGDFLIPYVDSLGVRQTVNLAECRSEVSQGGALGAYAGRGTPETCNIPGTVDGVSYTVVMETFSVPTDDHRLGFGVIAFRGSCDQLDGLVASRLNDNFGAECIIRGEAIKPGSAQGDAALAAGLPSPTWIGSEKPSWEGSERFEDVYCGDTPQTLTRYCRDEQAAIVNGRTCSWEYEAAGVDGIDSRCFCGDPENSPQVGGR